MGIPLLQLKCGSVFFLVYVPKRQESLLSRAARKGEEEKKGLRQFKS
jgi:hypothetical protein